jgi:nucleoside-diphosphate-sugar epimerase
MKILITGANGFIGTEVCNCLENSGNHELIKLSRKPALAKGFFQSPDLGPISNWRRILVDVDVVLHLAGRAHILNETISNPLDEFNRVNFEGTVSLAKQAIELGVKRFIFFSSIGVIGSRAGKEVLTEDTPLCPNMDYAESKAKAEVELQKLFDKSNSELVIIRPPLVYSGYAPGNFETLLKAVFKRMPLPLGAINNRRMLVSVYNLANFVETCIEFDGKASGTYIVSDNQEVSTTQILKYLAVGMGIKDRLFKVPYLALKILCTIGGKKEQLDKLCGDFLVDSSRAEDVFGWKPIWSTEKALQLAGQEYKNRLKEIK